MGTLFDGALYRVRYNPAGGDGAVAVVFDPWLDSPSLEGPFMLERFLADNGIAAIGVKSRFNDWYQGEEIHAVLAAIADVGRTRRLVGLGGSMGAYALINYADRMNLSSLAAIAPQFSIDRAVVPFETRWEKEAAGLVFTNHRIARDARLTRGHILFDPTSIDAEHVKLIRHHHDLAILPVYFSGHLPLAMLQQAGLLDGLLTDIIEERVDVGATLKAIRRDRRQSALFWHVLAVKLDKSGRRAAATEAARRSTTLPHWEPFFYARYHAYLLADSGRYDEATAALDPFVDDPADGATARDLVSQWRRTPVVEPATIGR